MVNAQQKQCPKCGHAVQIAANSCMHCGHNFTTQFVNQTMALPAQPDPVRNGYAITALVLGLLGMLLPTFYIYPVVAIACGVLAVVFGYLSFRAPLKGLGIGGFVCGLVALCYHGYTIAAFLHEKAQIERENQLSEARAKSRAGTLTDAPPDNEDPSGSTQLHSANTLPSGTTPPIPPVYNGPKYGELPKASGVTPSYTPSRTSAPGSSWSPSDVSSTPQVSEETNTQGVTEAPKRRPANGGFSGNGFGGGG